MIDVRFATSPVPSDEGSSVSGFSHRLFMVGLIFISQLVSYINIKKIISNKIIKNKTDVVFHAHSKNFVNAIESS